MGNDAGKSKSVGGGAVELNEDWVRVLTEHGLSVDEATVGVLEKSHVYPDGHPNLGFSAWWTFFADYGFSPRVTEIVRFADAGLQAGEHPYWGMRTWVMVLENHGVPVGAGTILRAHEAGLWATDPYSKGDGYAAWAQVAGDGSHGFELVVAAREQGVSLEGFPAWLEGPDSRIVAEDSEATSSMTRAPSSGLNLIGMDELVTVLSKLGDNPRLFASGNFAAPNALLRAADAGLSSFILHMLNAQKGLPSREGITYETCFVGAGMRGAPGLRYVPSRLSLVGVLLATRLVPDACLIHVSAPRHGRVSLGIETNIVPAAIEATRARGGIIIAQVNENMPYTYGDSEVDCTLIDYAVAANEPLPSVEGFKLDTVSERIGQNIAPLIPNGATLQLGIGGIPDAVLHSLKGQNSLSVWTEMFSDGVVKLAEEGRLNPDVPVCASFSFGSQGLYRWLDGNRSVKMLRTETINDPGRIAARTAMVSVNAALQVDLYAQANASRVKRRVFSGFGGSTDFIVGALHSPGGQAFIALPSWHKKSDTSTIVPVLQTPATSFQHSAVVTEQGVARVIGKTSSEQAQAIINYAADPRAREYLLEKAHELNIL